MAPQEDRRVARTVLEFVGGDGHAVLDRYVKSPRGLGRDRRHVFHHLLADVIHQFIEEDMTFIDLLEGDKLVRFVRLIDTARPQTTVGMLASCWNNPASVPKATLA